MQLVYGANTNVYMSTQRLHIFMVYLVYDEYFFNVNESNIINFMSNSLKKDYISATIADNARYILYIL